MGRHDLAHAERKGKRDFQHAFAVFQHNAFAESGMADVIAADLSRMAPLHQLMRQMRAQAEQAAQEAVREREAKARADAQADAAKPAKLVVRSADEFEF